MSITERVRPLQFQHKQLVKCVVWDLDNTIWSGILSEDSTVVLRRNIKSILHELDERGILNSISSKNNYTDALEKLKSFQIDHYFLYPQISWSAKSTHIKNIQKSLNIGFDTLAFIDDQQFELDEVGAVYPSVQLFSANEIDTLLDNPHLKPEFITEDSARRREMYLSELTRKQLEENYTDTPREFLRTLNLKCNIYKAREEDLARAEELTIRTNQLNTTGITYDYEELRSYLNSDNHILIMCELSDRYGTYGKVGLALIEKSKKSWCIKLLLMSCRVINRGAGGVLLTAILKNAKKNNVELYADFRQTDRNRQMFITYRFAGFREIANKEDGILVFQHDLNNVNDYPQEIIIDDSQL